MHESASAIFDADESFELNQHHFEVTRISEGLDFGEGAISGHDEPEVLAHADEAIQHSGEILVEVSRDEHGQVLEDDGCGDGRETKLIFRLKKFFNRNLNRAKVFGGAAAMTTAALISTGGAKGRSLNATFGDAIDLLHAKDMDFGAHTDENASGEDSGCGAIDKAPEVIHAALKYEEAITSVIDSLGVDTTGLEDVYDNLQAYVDEMSHHEPYSGRKVMDSIIKAGKVVKQLAGGHRERRIILNTVRGYTVNQDLIRKRTGGRAQAFAVDIWRLEDIAAKLFPEDSKKQSQAFLGELVYTLATSAVLTKGDLPVYMINDSPQSA